MKFNTIKNLLGMIISIDILKYIISITDISAYEYYSLITCLLKYYLLILKYYGITEKPELLCLSCCLLAKFSY